MCDPIPERESAPPPVHVPVLLGPVLDYLDLQSGLVVVDGTVGAGGHARHILERIQPGGRLIGLDRDPMMLVHAQRVLTKQNSCLIRASYAELGRVLRELDLELVDRVLIDLGLSSDQLADDRRGFSFDAEGPLDMRFDVSCGPTAAELVNRAPEAELARIFFEYGEERHSRRIARRIVAQRPIRSAAALAELVRRATPPQRGRQRIHPATRVFQALRIAVNDELAALRTFLDHELPRVLRPGGRAVVISFHSLEDRLVKQAFRNRDRWENLTRKPVIADDAELRANPRSRSAKLRAAVIKGQVST